MKIKNIFFLSLVLAFALSAVCGAASVRGDMDGSGTVDTDDAIYLLRHALMPDRYPIAQSGDVDGSGAVDTDDAIYLLRHALMPDRYPLRSPCIEHTEEIIPAVAATCTQTGLTEGKKCTVCGEITVKQTEISALGHKEEAIPAVAPTCTEYGLTEGTGCSRCNEIFKKQYKIAPLGHDYNSALCLECGETIVFTPNRYFYFELLDDGTYSIEYNSNLPQLPKNVVVPPTYSGKPVTSIGFQALFQEDVMETCMLPNTITVLDYGVFRCCDRLKTVMIPRNVKTMDHNMFSQCPKLDAVTIPASVTSIGLNMFIYCPELEYINVEEGNRYYKSVDGVLFNKAGTVIYDYPNGKPDETYVVPHGVTTAEHQSFLQACYLKHVILPDTLTTVAAGLFFGCDALESVYIPKSVRTITTGSYVTLVGECPNFTEFIVDEDNLYFSSIDGNLYNKSGTKLISYAVGKKDETFVIPSTVKTLGNYCFASANNLKTMTIPKTVTTFEGYEFHECNGLETVIIEDGIKKLTKGLFYQCKSLKKVVIPESVTYIDNGCFRDCESLCEVNFHDKLTYIGYTAFRYNNFTSLMLPGSLKSVEYAAFAVSHNLKTVTLGEGITKIDEDAFYYCDALTEIYIPSTVTYIGENAFEQCQRLQKIYFNGTKAQWLAVEKDPKWNRNTGYYRVYCTDGTLSK